MPRICITVPNKTPQPYRFPLDTEEVLIGRSAANDVVVDHGSVSSHHCVMKRVPGGFVLEDKDSTNGLFLDEERMEVIDLKNNMDYEVGDIVFNYQLKDEEQDELADEKFRPLQRKKKVKKKKAGPKAAPAARAAAPAPSPLAPPTVTAISSDNGARDFGYFAIFAILASFAFYFGLNSSHKAMLRDTVSREERKGRTFLKDIQNPPAETEKK